MRFPVRPLRDAWPRWTQRGLERFFWSDPRLMLDSECSAADFGTSMAALRVGKTIKITGSGRHQAADRLLLDHVATSDAVLVDIGASDGTTSVELIEKLGDFRRFVIADLYLSLTVREYRGRTYFATTDETLVLTVSRWFISWPTLSRVLAHRFRRSFYRARGHAEAHPVLLLNPRVRGLLSRDSRVEAMTHDVFVPIRTVCPDVIKVANLLRRLYFSDEEIVRGLRALLASLAPGGHLLVVDNPRIAGIDERAGLYRRTPDGFERVDHTAELPEIDDLVTGLR